MNKCLFSFTLLFLGVQALFAQLPDEGQASYYNDKFQGSPTSSGEKYNKNAFTCAHRTLPFGTKIQVTNLANGKSVIVKVNDRGPHSPNRILDLSRAGAEAIDMIRSGVAQVRIEAIDVTASTQPAQPTPPDRTVFLPPANSPQSTQPNQAPANAGSWEQMPPAVSTLPAAPSQTTPATPAPLPNIGYTPPPVKVVDETHVPNPAAYPPPATALPEVAPKPAKVDAPMGVVISVTSPSTSTPTPSTPAASTPPKNSSLEIRAFPTAGYGIQAGAFRSQANALELVKKLQSSGLSLENLWVMNSSGSDLFKVIVGPYASEQDALIVQQQLRVQKINGVVINLATF